MAILGLRIGHSDGLLVIDEGWAVHAGSEQMGRVRWAARIRNLSNRDFEIVELFYEFMAIQDWILHREQRMVWVGPRSSVRVKGEALIPQSLVDDIDHSNVLIRYDSLE